MMELSKEGELLCLLNLARLEGNPSERAKQLISEGISWDRFTELAEINAVTVLSVQRLFSLGVSVPAVLEAKVRELLPVCEARLKSARNLMRAMHEAGVEVILLKGGLLLSEIYDIPAYKKMNDIDILVRWDQVELAISVLKKCGFSSVGPLIEKKEVSSKSHHTPPYVSSDLSCVVGLHWGLHSPLARWRSESNGIWKRKVRAQFLGVPAFRMSWEDNLLHLCMHLPFFKIGLRELADVYNLVLFSQPSVDWNLFSARVIEWDVADPVYRVLTLADALMPLGIPQGLLSQWKNSATSFTRKDTQARLQVTDLLLESRSVQIGKIEKAFAVFRMTKSRRERRKAWLAMWFFLLVTTDEERRRIMACKEWRGHWDRILGRIQVPVRLWCAMARDYGQIPLTLVTALNALIVIKDGIYSASSLFLFLLFPIFRIFRIFRIFPKDGAFGVSGASGAYNRDLPYKKILEALE